MRSRDRDREERGSWRRLAIAHEAGAQYARDVALRAFEPRDRSIGIVQHPLPVRGERDADDEEARDCGELYAAHTRDVALAGAPDRFNAGAQERNHRREAR